MEVLNFKHDKSTCENKFIIGVHFSLLFVHVCDEVNDSLADAFSPVRAEKKTSNLS